jgi:hypothetical protein
MHTQKPCSGGTIELNHVVYIPTTNPLSWLLCVLAFSLTSNLKFTVYTYYQSIEHSLMASVYLSFLSDKQPEIHCIPYVSTSVKRPPPFKDHFFLAQMLSLKAGFMAMVVLAVRDGQ